MGKVTIYDVAKKANCSPATVSLVLKNSDRVKAETKEHVLEVINRLNYTPNYLAQSLITKSTHTLGLIVPNIENPQFACMVAGVEEYTNKNGYDLIFGVSNSNREKESLYLDMLQKKRVDGLIIFPTFIDNVKAKIEESLKDKIPVVLCGSSGDNIKDINYVKCDNRMGSFTAINHLVDIGHKKIGCIFPVIDKKQSKSRLIGYQDSLHYNGIEYNEALIKYCPVNNEAIFNATVDLLKTQKPDAVFCLYDYCAAVVINAIHSLGLRIPEDIAVIGYDNIPLSKYFPIPLSTIDTHGNKTGMIAAEMLLQKIKEPDTPMRQVLLKPELVVRASTVKE